MTCSNSISVRFQDDLEISKLPKTNGDKVIKVTYKIDGSQILEPSSRRAKETGKTRKSLKARILFRVFSEDYERVNRKILDPREPAIRRWNKIFLVASLVSLFVDPLFFYLPKVHDNIYICLFLHSLRCASSRVFGRGELVIDYSKIVSRYLRKRFWIDVIAALPLPQVLIWLVIPNLRGSTMANTKAWQGAAYNLMLYMLASHVLGASWYLLSIERQEACWISVCKLEKGSCQSAFFDCHRVNDPDRNTWFQSTNITNVCDPNSSSYPFGIYRNAIKSNVTSSMFFNKYFYCLWWGLNNLSSLGQNLSTIINVEEISFAIIIANLGLVLFALLIGNMQTYLQSTTARLEE
ncbi:unnamed protein product [Camellia sinensis]